MLPPIPAKRYFTIGEVSELCGVKPYVLRYWEQEFTQLKPMKRRGNRRYYQHHEVLLVRRIRELLYDQGFTISGARNRLTENGAAQSPGERQAEPGAESALASAASAAFASASVPESFHAPPTDAEPAGLPLTAAQVRAELESISALLSG